MSTASKAVTLARDLEAICGAEHVRLDQTTTQSRSIDKVTPQAVVSPATAQQIADVLKFAAERDLVVVPAGNFSRQHIGRTPARIDIVVETTRLNTINYFEPGDLTIGVQAGAKFTDVLAHVEAKGETLPIDPQSASRTTFGSIVATCASGPLRFSYGSVRDFCLGVEFATAGGKVAKAGGRVVKNVAGYDVTKLLVGSYGTLAIITAANFRVFPRQRQTRTFIADFKNFDDALTARDRIVLGSPLTPLALELISPTASRMTAPQFSQEAWRLALRAGGSDAVLARYRQELGSMVTSQVEGAEEAKLWTAIADFADTLFARAPRTMIVRITLPQERLRGVVARAQEVADAKGFSFSCAGRAVTPIYLAFVPGDRAATYPSLLDELRRAVGPDGVVAVTHCHSEVKRSIDIWGTSATDTDAMTTVKRTFDPRDILNRGRFLL